MSKRETTAGPAQGRPSGGNADDPRLPPRPVARSRSSCPSCKTLLAALSIAIALIALVIYNLPILVLEYEAWRGYGWARTYDDLPPGVMDQFRVYDENGDGYLDPQEFVVLGLRLREELDQFHFEDAELNADQEVVMVRAELKPLVLESMNKFHDKHDFYFGSPENLLPGLVQWTIPQHPDHPYGVGNFRVFLPPSDEWPTGKPYYVIEPLSDSIAGVHQNRYRPFAPVGKEVFLFTLLTQFHPNVFVHTRFGPRGTTAVIRAQNDDYLDIVIRAHAEYQLNEEPNFPFWFTPAQFAGRLIISRRAEHVEMFELSLPTDRQLNIDMEWLIADANEVDIGYMPKMRLYAVHPSEVLANGSAIDMTEHEFNESSIDWREEITQSEAKQILERTLYPFKKVTYSPFLEAFRLARSEGKLVHSILLWGALDDQSC